MAVRPVVVWPDPRLREETRAIAAITDEVRRLYADLRDSMYAENGLGIAAVQIGEPVKLFLVEAKLAGRNEGDEPVAFINPEIVWVSEETAKAEEGCLSFPGIYVHVERPLRAKVRALGLDGKTFEMDGEGLLARCMLHEYDHLTGKLLVDFVGPLKKRMIKRKLERAAADGADEMAAAD
jgi:peptide deformylase